MSRPVLVGFDGSEHGGDALALGEALASSLAAPLIVLVAYTPEQWLWAPGTAEPLDAEERRSVAARAKAALAARPDLDVRVVASPSAAGALQAEAEREGAQIVVVGSSHRGTLGRVLLGTVTQEVLDAAPCAVAVAPAGLAGSPPRFSKVGVGFDDSASAHDALAVARGFAVGVGAELRLIWAAHLTTRALPLAATSYANPDYFEEVRAEVEDRLRLAVDPIREEIAARGDIVRGGTADALIEQSEHLDLLVLGSRGYGPLRRVLMGSVSRRVVNGARCPVVVVPKGVRALDDVAPLAESEPTAPR
jgi:nucleotide-binding universal stress UspA family protein